MFSGYRPALVHSRKNAAIVARMREEELRAATAGDQLIEVVRGRRAGARADALLEVAVVQQAEVAVVDHLVLLALAQRLDRELELLLGLVHRLVVEIGDAGVDPQHRLRDAELVLARRQLVVDEGPRQRRLTVVAGCQRDLRLAGLVLRQLRQHLERLEVRGERLVLIDELLEVRLTQGQHRARRHRLGREVPEVAGLEQDLVAEVVAVRPRGQHDFVAVLPDADLLDLAPRDEHDLVGRLSALDEHVAGADLALLELARERREAVHVVVRAQERDLAELGRDDVDVRADVREGQPPVADRVAEPAVDAVCAASRLHPGQHAQQPARGDALHLRFRLGRRREISRRRGAKAQLRGLGLRLIRINGHA